MNINKYSLYKYDFTEDIYSSMILSIQYLVTKSQSFLKVVRTRKVVGILKVHYPRF